MVVNRSLRTIMFYILCYCCCFCFLLYIYWLYLNYKINKRETYSSSRNDQSSWEVDSDARKQKSPFVCLKSQVMYDSNYFSRGLREYRYRSAVDRRRLEFYISLLQIPWPVNVLYYIAPIFDHKIITRFTYRFSNFQNVGR